MDGTTPLRDNSRLLEDDDDFIMAEKILKEKNNPDFYISSETALHIAATSGKLNLVKMLIDAGANVNIQSIDLKETPLHNAALKGHVEVCAFLLKNGATPTLKTLHRSTALRLACLSGHADVVTTLLDACIEVINVGDRQGRTPLITAIEQGHETVVEKLINCAANFQEDGHDEKGGADRIKSLVNVCDCMHRSPVFYAVRKRYGRILKILIDVGASVNLVDNHSKMSPLRYASRYNFVDMIAILLESGRCEIDLQPKISHRNTNAFTALMEAVHKGNLSAVKLLLRYGANPNIASKDGLLANVLYAMLLSNHYDLEITHALLEAGLKVNVCNQYNYSLLQFTIDKNWLPLAELLVTADIDFDKELAWINSSLQNQPSVYSEEVLKFLESLVYHGDEHYRFLSLKRLCRKAINSHFDKGSEMLSNYIERLPLPIPIIDYLLYRRC